MGIIDLELRSVINFPTNTKRIKDRENFFCKSTKWNVAFIHENFWNSIGFCEKSNHLFSVKNNKNFNNCLHENGLSLPNWRQILNFFKLILFYFRSCSTYTNTQRKKKTYQSNSLSAPGSLQMFIFKIQLLYNFFFG